MFFGIIFPVVLFLFRYILPAEFEKALTKKTKEKKQILIELIHFPIELLIVAIGYTIPKTIEYLMLIQNNIKGNMLSINSTTLVRLTFNILFSFFLLLVIPFIVAKTKTIEKIYFESSNADKKGVNKKIILTYIMGIVVISIALVLGV